MPIQSPDDLEAFVKVEGFVRRHDRDVFYEGLRDDFGGRRDRPASPDKLQSSYRTLESATHVRLLADQHDARVRITQLRSSSNTSRPGVEGWRRPVGMKGSAASRLSTTALDRLLRSSRRTLRIVRKVCLCADDQYSVTASGRRPEDLVLLDLS